MPIKIQSFIKFCGDTVSDILAMAYYAYTVFGGTEENAAGSQNTSSSSAKTRRNRSDGNKGAAFLITVLMCSYHMERGMAANVALPSPTKDSKSDQPSCSLFATTMGFFPPVSHRNHPEESVVLTAEYAALDGYAFSKFTDCRLVTPDFIEKFYVPGATQLAMRKATAAIMEMKNIDPVIESYIDIVFNYLPGFQIQLISQEKMREIIITAEGQSRPDVAAMYDSMTYRVYILSKETTYDEFDKAMIRHEFRHALMHVVQIANLKLTHGVDTECYFPRNKKERLKVASLMKKGDKNVERLRALLKRAETTALTLKEEKYLQQLRKISSQVYEKHYRVTVFTGILQNIRTIEVFPDLGPARFIDPVIKDGKNVLQWELLDPLWGLVYEVNKVISYVEKNYPAESHLRERDAFLFQVVPVPLIEALYPEYFQYTQQLVLGIEFPERIHLDSMAEHKFSYLHEFDMERLLTRPDYFSISRADDMLYAMKRYLKMYINIDQCITGANILITKGIHVKEAHLILAEAAYFNRDYHLAAKHYGVILNPPVSDSLPILEYRYANSLASIGKYEQAKEIIVRLVAQPPIKLGKLKSTLEEFLDKIETAQQQNYALQ